VILLAALDLRAQAGWRALPRVPPQSRLQLLSRNRQQLNDTYPELVAALAGPPAEHYIVDGEIVAFEGSTTSFFQAAGAHRHPRARAGAGQRDQRNL
jgi:ATP-dependent DNA ligase